MTVEYSKTSPYYGTTTYRNFLDVRQHRRVPPQADDATYTIKEIHQYRPDLLAYDVYGDPSLWWVFIARNPNTLEDPVWDFKAGKKIFIPKKSTLEEALGL